MSRTKEINTEPCKVCGIIIRYKGDVARHEQLHKTNDAVRMFKCTYEGCTYQTLQKSNLNTHLCTHTGEKPHACPDCDFRTADPGCLTRHRKRKHAYVPNRKTGKAKAYVDAKESQRHTPYKRKEVASSSSPAPGSDLLPEDLSFTMSSTYASFDASDASYSGAQDNKFSHTWDKCLFSLEGTSATFQSFTPLDFFPSSLSPAIDTCSQLFGGVDSFDDMFSQCPQAIAPAETFFTETSLTDEDLSWIFDPHAIQAAASAMDDSIGYYGSPASSSYSLDFLSSPVTSAFSPESYFSDCSPELSCLSSSPLPSPSDVDHSFTEFLSSTSLLTASL